MSNFRKVCEFHEKMGVRRDGDPGALPGEIDPSALELLKAARDQIRRTSNGDWLPFRLEFMLEELIEYADAARAGDLEGQLDALVDLAYVVYGTADQHGFDEFDAAFETVHRANLEKERGTAGTSKRRSPFDVVKPPGWEPPDLSIFTLPRAERARIRGATAEPVDVIEAEVIDLDGRPSSTRIEFVDNTFEDDEDDDDPRPTRRGFFNL